MKIIKKLSILVCVVIIVVSSSIAFVGCGIKEKKAIIMIPGIGISALYNSDTNEPVYAIGEINGTEIINLVTNAKTIFGSLQLNEDGTSNYNLRAATTDDPTAKYGMLNFFEPMYNVLQEKYGKKYDVVVWQYDWRFSNDVTKASLEQFIASKGYDKVVLVGHSMGGNVISRYLLDGVNREKVEKVISIGAPLLGALDAFWFLYDGLFANIPAVLENMNIGSINAGNFFNDYEDLINRLGVKRQLKSVLSSIQSLYEIMPIDKYYSDPFKGEANFGLGTHEVLNFDNTLSHLATLPLLKQSDGSTIRHLNAYNEWHNREWIDGKHVTTMVDSYYIVGNKVDTLRYFSVDDKGAISSKENYKDGDGIVSVWSATCGLGLEHEKVTVLDGLTHLSIGQDSATFDEIVKILG